MLIKSIFYFSKGDDMTFTTHHRSDNSVARSTWHQHFITLQDPTYLLDVLDALDSDDSNGHEFEQYLDWLFETISTINRNYQVMQWY